MAHPANAPLVVMLKTGLTDIRMLAIRLFIEDLIERKTYGGGIDRYRIKNKDTDQFVTSLDDIKTAITADTVKVAYPYKNGEGMMGDRITGVEVTLLNLEVMFNKYSTSDGFFSQFYDIESGKPYRFVLNMAYMNDAADDDPVMKICHIRLVQHT